MKLYHLYDTTGEMPTRLKKHPNPNSGLPTKWELPDGLIPPILEGMAYIVQDLTIPSYDPETQIIETKVTLEKNGKVVRDLTDEEIAARNVAMPTTATKLTIMKRLEAFGKWETFKGVLATLPTNVQDSWTLAQDIRSDDPLFTANADALMTALDLSDEEFNTILA